MTKTSFMLALAFSTAVHSQQAAPTDGSAAPSRWTPYASGGYVHQFDTDLDDGGKFDIDRLFVQGGISYSFGPRRRISFAVNPAPVVTTPLAAVHSQGSPIASATA